MDKQFETPVLFLVFNRPDTTQQVFNQIRQIKPKYLFVAADGPRSENPDEFNLCTETREIIQKIDWKCEVKTLLREENFGCGKAVSEAITWFFDQVEYGIILEDDCLPDVSFFRYCDELLRRYKNDEDVFMISGSNMQNGHFNGKGSYYFSYYSITWGWATWRRAWHNFQNQLPDIEKNFSSGKLDHVFQSNSEKKFWYHRIKSTEKLGHKIWDYQWFYTIWRLKGIGIVPNSNLILNLGFSNNSTHSFLKDSIRGPSSINSLNFPMTHPAKRIDRKADYYTYKEVFSHSFHRGIRLIFENGPISVIKYFCQKLVD